MKILIADDSRVMRQIVTRTLRQAGYSGHDVVEAANGREAFEMVRAENPDLVLSDWNMPEMSGLELLRHLRGTGQNVPFGFVTSEGSPDMRQQAEDAGAMFVIAKPFTEETFREALDPILGSSRPPGNPQPKNLLCEMNSERVSTMAPTVLPNPKEVKDMLEGLLGRDVTVAPSPPVEADKRMAVGVFVDDSMQMTAVAVADFGLAAYAGAAIGLVPRGGAQASMEDGVLAENLRENFDEVLDVLSALFNVPDRPHLKLYATYAPGELPPTDVAQVVRSLGRRLDLDVDVNGYGRGRLSLVLA